jgi:hypothetical protein
MKYAFRDNSVDKLRQNETDLNSRLEAQSEALRDLECTNPVVGKWIDAYDVEYLISALELDDEDFAKHFPALEYLKQSDREKMISAFTHHMDHECAHCGLKRGFDAEFSARVERSMRPANLRVVHSSEQAQPESPAESVAQPPHATATAIVENK